MSWLRLHCWLVVVLGLAWSVPARADALRVQVLNQTPVNTVSRSQPTIAYSIKTSNVSGGRAPTTIGVGINISVDGSQVSASSGEFTSSGCVVDRSLSNSWACTNLGEGSSQTPTFTWTAPRPGQHTVTFTGFCQVIPVQNPFKPCTSANSDAALTIVENNAPNGTIDSPSSNVTIAAGSSVSFSGSGSDPDGDTPLSYAWNFNGGATNSSAEDPGAVTFATAGTYTVSFTVKDRWGTADPSPATVSITVTAPKPTVTLAASPTSVNLGSSTELSWTVTNATSCTADGGWTGAKATGGGSENVTPSGSSSTYGLTCGGPGGSVRAEVTVPVLSVCGDGIVSGVEACDLGEDNGSAGACCTSGCTFRAASDVCRAAASTCDIAENCSGASSACPIDHFAAEGITCTDGNACTVTDTCNGSGACRPGSARSCDDGLFCNGAETCDTASGCRPGVAPAVNDSVSCTADSCDELNDRVVHSADSALCDDGKWCNGAETCHVTQGCLAGAAPNLSDSVECTEDACDEANDRAVHTVNSALCDDGKWCNGVETCHITQGCLSGAAPNLDDSVACTEDLCDEANDRAVHTPRHERCDDGRRCNGDETCHAESGCEPGGLNRCAEAEVGAACSVDDSCQSGACVDGVCCATACAGACVACSKALTGGRDGDCLPIAAGKDPKDGCDEEDEDSCGRDGTCDGLGACRLYEEGTICSSDLCKLPAVADTPDTCDGQGHCLERGPVPCQVGYACVGFACKDSCDADGDCVATHHCIDQLCVADLPRGASCTESGHCQSNHCVDGVCCDSSCDGACRACSKDLKGVGADGICEPIARGSDPDQECDVGADTCAATGLCDGEGSCERFAPETTPCGATSCEADVVSGALCDGAGDCRQSRASCGAYLCDGKACATSCATNEDCAEAAFCTTAGSCAERRPTSASCTDSFECASGFCADGFCCETACDGQCEACDLAGFLGECVAVAGDPHGARPTCAGGATVCGGTCDGETRDACTYPGALVSCAATACKDGAVSPQVCDGAGACADGEPLDCAPYGCDSEGCKQSCKTEDDCVSGSSCQDSVCAPVSTKDRCVDESTLLRAGKMQVCFPYRCQHAACLDSCESTDDCVLGRSCLENACVEETILPHSNKEDGCSCVLPGGSARHRGSGTAACLVFVCAGLLLRGRRRRLRPRKHSSPSCCNRFT